MRIGSELETGRWWRSIVTPPALCVLGLISLPLLLEVLMPVGPRWPSGPGVAALSSGLVGIFVLATARLVGSLIRLQLSQTRWLPWSCGTIIIAALAGFVAHMSLDSEVCWTVPPSTSDPLTGRDYRHRIVGGRASDVTENAKSLIESGLTIPGLLSENEFLTDGIWSESVVSRSRLLLISTWLMTCTLFAIGCGLLLKTVPRTSKPAPLGPGDDQTTSEETPAQLIRQLHQLLQETFDRNSLDQLLRIDLSEAVGETVTLEAMTSDDSFNEQVFQVLRWAEQRDWLSKLIRVAASKRPDQSEWQELVQRVLNTETEDQRE